MGKSNMDFNPYKVLAVDPSADIEVVAAAYRALSKKYHPDVNPSPVAQAMMSDINRAYDMLKDPDKRRQVDEQLARTRTYVPPRSPSPGQGQSGGFPTPDWNGIGEQFRKTVDNVGDFFSNISKTSTPDQAQPQPRPGTNPNMGNSSRPFIPTPSARDRELTFYRRELSDSTERTSIKIAVFHHGAINQKLGEIRLSAPNERNIVTSNEILLDSQAMFDLTLALSEARRLLKEPATPIEMTADYDVYFRQQIAGLNGKAFFVEVIKRTRGGGVGREAAILVGDRNPRAERDSVVISQSATRLEQLETNIQAAMRSMR
jgi:curved DNA-binding protein CbpA